MRTPGSRTAALLLILTAGPLFSQPRAPDRPRAFPSITFEAVPAQLTPGQSGAVTLHWAPLKLENGRLTGLDDIYRIVEFACFDLLAPYRMEPTGRGRPIRPYRIDATVPRGTTPDEVRAMLRLYLAERLHLRYHLAQRPTPVYHLVRGPGEPTLDPVRPLPPGPHPGAMWLLNSYAQPVGKLAEFLSSVVGREVLDKTGIQGQYSFQIDWRDEFQKSATKSDPALAQRGAEKFGLDLVRVTEIRRFLIVDHLDP